MKPKPPSPTLELLLLPGFRRRCVVLLRMSKHTTTITIHVTTLSNSTITATVTVANIPSPKAAYGGYASMFVLIRVLVSVSARFFLVHMLRVIRVCEQQLGVQNDNERRFSVLVVTFGAVEGAGDGHAHRTAPSGIVFLSFVFVAVVDAGNAGAIYRS